jgi:hypothetical protein
MIITLRVWAFVFPTYVANRPGAGVQRGMVLAVGSVDVFMQADTVSIQYVKMNFNWSFYWVDGTSFFSH